MISMTTFSQIIALRNKGLTQDEIAKTLGISRRSVIRYLKNGSIPVYSRNLTATRVSPLENYFDEVKSKLEQEPRILLNDLHQYLADKGYQGSVRTLRRKTASLRKKLKHKEVYFSREIIPGEVMEGDFTEINILIGGIKRKIYIWVSTLPFSNSIFAKAYYNCSFESFADGSIGAFNEFGGVATKYRLDNMSPVVTKILKGRDRLVTKRYAEFQEHFRFFQDFCNPAKGNEKGNVESNNNHFKKKIQSQILLRRIKFTSLDAFNIFLLSLCHEHNEKVKEKFDKENLKPLPLNSFKCFRTDIFRVNKFSLFSLGTSGHMYSAPSEYIGLSVEVRIYPSFLEVYSDGELICSHHRLHGPRGLVSIDLKHILSALIKKPGAMKDWKYRHLLFERPVWKNFYQKLTSKGGSDKDYLKCLKLINKYGHDLVTTAMEMAMEENSELSAKTLLYILSSEFENITQMKPLTINLVQYDEFLKGVTNGIDVKNQS